MLDILITTIKIIPTPLITNDIIYLGIFQGMELRAGRY